MPFKVTHYFDIVAKECDRKNVVDIFVEYLKNNPIKAHEYYLQDLADSYTGKFRCINECFQYLDHSLLDFPKSLRYIVDNVVIQEIDNETLMTKVTHI